MHNVFLDMLYQYVSVYLDDILVHSESASEHVEHLRVVFEQLRQHKLYAKQKKCTFCWRKSLELLSFKPVQSCFPGCEDVSFEEL